MALLGGGGNDIRIRFLADTTQVGAAVSEMGSGISQGLGLASIGWAAAGAAAVTFAKQSVDAAMEAEQAQAHLADAYARFPALHDVTLKSLNDLADATMRKTRYDDEAVRAAESNLAQFHLTGAEIEKLIPLVADFAAKTGKDLPTAAESIGKALLGNTRALKEVGISYKSTGDAATDYANISRLLAEQVGGAAAADADTTAGKLEMLKNAYGELKEQIGTALLPLIQAIIPPLIQLLQATAPAFQLLGDAMQWASDHGLLFTVMFASLGPMLGFVLDHVAEVSAGFSQFGDVLRDVGNWLRSDLGPALADVGAWLADLWASVVDVADAVGGFFADAWGAAAGAIRAVGAAVAWVIDKLNALAGVWRSVSGFFSKLGGIVGLSAPLPPSGALGAPTLAIGAYGAARGAGPASVVPGGLTVNVNVHGNVGDPTVIGRRVVEALGTFSRLNGSRALSVGLGLT